MRGTAQSFSSGTDGNMTDAAVASLRGKASAGAKDLGRSSVGKAFQSGHNIAGWDRKARWQRAVNLARDKMGITGMDDSADKWGSGPRDTDGGDGGGERRSSSAQPTRRGSVIGLGVPGAGPLPMGAPGTIVELRTPIALKEHLKRGRGARETGIQLATLEQGLDGLSEEATAALVAQFDQRRQMLNGAPASPGRPATLKPADRALRAWTNPATNPGTNSAAGAGTGGGGGSSSNGPSSGPGGTTAAAAAVSSFAINQSGERSSSSGSNSSAGGGGSYPLVGVSVQAVSVGALIATGSQGSAPSSQGHAFAGGVSHSAAAGYGTSHDGSAGPSTPTGFLAGMPFSGARTAFVTSNGVAVSGGVGGGGTAGGGGGGGGGGGSNLGGPTPRRFSECGSASFSMGAGSGATGGSNTAAAVGGGATFPAVRRSCVIPADVSIIARPSSARRESVTALRTSADSVAGAGGAFGVAAADLGGGGGGGVLSAALDRFASADSPPVATRSRPLSRQASGVFLAPLELSAPALTTSADAGVGAGGGGGGGISALQPTLRPGSAGRRPSVSGTGSAAGTSAAGTPPPLPSAPAAAAIAGGPVDSPFATPQPLPRALPALQVPHSPPEHISSALPSRQILPSAGGGGGGAASASGPAATMPEALLLMRRSAPQAQPPSPSPSPHDASSPSLLVAVASPSTSTAASNLSSNAAHGTPLGGAVASGSGGGTATGMMPVPPPPPQDAGSLAAAPRRPRNRASATDDGSASLLPLNPGSSPSQPPPAMHHPWAAPASPAPSSPPPPPPMKPSVAPGYGTETTPEPTPPASPLLQHLVLSPSAAATMVATAVTPVSSTAATALPAGAATTTTTTGGAAAAAAAPVPRLPLQDSPSSPWPSVAPGYRRSISSSPGTATGPGALPANLTVPQPPSSPQTHRPFAPTPPPAPPAAHPPGQHPPYSPTSAMATSPGGYRRSSVTIPASLGGGGGGGGAAGGVHARTSILSHTTHASVTAPGGLGGGGGVGTAGGGSGGPAVPRTAEGGAEAAVGGAAFVSPRRPSIALMAGIAPAAGKMPPGDGGSAAAAAAAAAATGTAAAIRTPISDAVLADLRTVATEVEAELTREAEVAAVVRQATAQALRMRIRMSDSGKARNNVSMPGDPWRKW